MQSIDFLPPTYRQPRAQRNVRLWNLLVVVLFGGVISGAALAQGTTRKRVAMELAQFEARHAQAKLTKAEWLRMSERLQTGGNEAQLQAYLEHPWPKTRILEAVVRNIPSSITFQQLLLIEEEVTSGASEFNGPFRSQAGETNSEAEAAKLPPPTRDFQQLRESYDNNQVILHITGLAPDAAVVHRYVRQLNRETIIARAELVSLEGLPEHNGVLESEFRLRLIMMPPYGQADGPQGTPPLFFDIAGAEGDAGS